MSQSSHVKFKTFRIIPGDSGTILIELETQAHAHRSSTQIVAAPAPLASSNAYILTKSIRLSLKKVTFAIHPSSTIHRDQLLPTLFASCNSAIKPYEQLDSAKEWAAAPATFGALSS
jgi:hypothetical protein